MKIRQRLRDMVDRIMGVGYQQGASSFMYKGYRIQPNPYTWMVDNYIFSHQDYNGPGDPRVGTANGIDEAKRLIDELRLDE